MDYFVPSTNEIVVGAYSQRQRTKNLAHELGHHVARVDDRAENECVAEGIAYIVRAHCGIDAGERSYPYGAQDRAALKNVLGTIQVASAILTHGVEAVGPIDARGGRVPRNQLSCQTDVGSTRPHRRRSTSPA